MAVSRSVLLPRKAGLAPAFLFAARRSCCLLPPKRGAIQQTVDGLQRALEIGVRSSYVPSSPIGVRSRPFPGGARLNAARRKRQEMPRWMK
jgi:hypothetical protein